MPGERDELKDYLETAMTDPAFRDKVPTATSPRTSATARTSILLDASQPPDNVVPHTESGQAARSAFPPTRTGRLLVQSRLTTYEPQPALPEG